LVLEENDLFEDCRHHLVNSFVSTNTISNSSFPACFPLYLRRDNWVDGADIRVVDCVMDGHPDDETMDHELLLLFEGEEAYF
jgi:hypothetical protein